MDRTGDDPEATSTTTTAELTEILNFFNCRKAMFFLQFWSLE